MLFEANPGSKYRMEVTKTLLLVIFVFLFVHLIGITYYILANTAKDQEEFLQKWFLLGPIQQLALIFNSSINFVLYCISGAKFRKEFKTLCCQCMADPVQIWWPFF